MIQYLGWTLPDADRHFRSFMQTHPDNHYQQQALDLAVSHCANLDLVIDVGANIGLFATRFSAIFQRVVCFEPTTVVYDCLRANCRHATNVEIYKVGLDHEPGLVTMTAPADSHNVGVYSIRDFVGSQQDLEHETVPVVALDQFGLKPDLIKIDTQGFEPNVLRGAMETLAACDPVLLIEVESPAVRSELQKLLTPIGYRAIAAVRHDQVWVKVPIDACDANNAPMLDPENSNEIEQDGATTDHDQT